MRVPLQPLPLQIFHAPLMTDCVDTSVAAWDFTPCAPGAGAGALRPPSSDALNDLAY